MSAVQKPLIGEVAHGLDALWCDVHGVWVSGWVQACGTKIESAIPSERFCLYRNLRVSPAAGSKGTVSVARRQRGPGLFRVSSLPAVSPGHVERGHAASDHFDRTRGARATERADPAGSIRTLHRHDEATRRHGTGNRRAGRGAGIVPPGIAVPTGMPIPRLRHP